MKFKLSKLKYIDLFGRRMELSMNGQKSHKTWCGTFCTLMIFGICAISAVYYIAQFFRRANPQYIYSEVYDSIIEEENDDKHIPFQNVAIGSDGFFAMMGLENKDYNINEYKVQFTILQQGKIVSQQQAIKCSEINYFQDLLNNPIISKMQNFQIVKQNPQNFVCLGNNQVDKIELVYEAQTAIFIQLSCSDIQSCQKLKDQRLLILTSDYLVVLQDFSDPLELYLMSNYIDLDLNYNTIVDASLQKVLIQTDVGYFTREFEYKQQITFKDFKRYNQVRTPSSYSQPLLTIQVQPFSKRQVYERSYPKFLSVLSIIGGLLKTLLVVGYFCSKPFSKLSMRSKLVNQLFTFEKTSSKKPRKIHEIEGQIEDDFNNHEDKNFKFPRSKTLTFTQGKQEQNKKDKEQALRSFEKLKENQIKLQTQHNCEQISYIKNTPYSNYNFDTNTYSDAHHSNLINSSRQFVNNNGYQQKQFFSYPVNHFSQETYSVENLDNQKYDLKQYQKSQNHEDNMRYSPIQKQYSYNSEMLSEDQFNSVNQNNAQSINQNDLGQKHSFKLFNTNCGFQKDSQFIGQNDIQSDKNSNIFKEQKISKQNDFDYGNLKTFQTQQSQDLTTQEHLNTQPNHQIFNHLEFETARDKSSITQSTRSSIKKINQSKQLKYSLSQYEESNKGNILDLQKQLEEKNLMQRRNANFDRDKKAFIKKVTQRGSLFSNLEQSTQNQDQGKDSKKTSIKLTKKETLQKKESIKSKGQQTQIEGEQTTTSRKIKSFISSKTKEIADLIRFNINQRKQNSIQNKDDDTQKNHDSQNNNQQPQSEIEDEKDKKKSNLLKQKTNKKFEGILNEKQEKSMILNLIDYVKYFFACFKDTSKVKQMKYTNKKVKKRLDIIYILEKLIEIDKLKVLLLNPDQINLFDYMPKEFVQFNNTESTDIYDKDNKFATWSLLCAEKTALDKYSNACIAYHHIQQNSNKTKIDKKLIQMLDPQVKRYFNSMIIQPEELNQYRALLADYSVSDDEKNQNINQMQFKQQSELNQNEINQQQNIFNFQIHQNLLHSNQQYQNQINLAQSQNFNQINNNVQISQIQFHPSNQFQQQDKMRSSQFNQDILNSQRLADKLNFSSFMNHDIQSNYSVPEQPIKGERNIIRLQSKKKSLSPNQTRYEPSKFSPDFYKDSNDSPENLALNILKNNNKLNLKYQCQAPIIEESNLFLSSEQFGGSLKQPREPSSPTSFPKLEEKKSHLFFKRTQSISGPNQESQREESQSIDEQKSQIEQIKNSTIKIEFPGLNNKENDEEVIHFENTDISSLNQTEKLAKSPSTQMKDKNFQTNSNML